MACCCLKTEPPRPKKKPTPVYNKSGALLVTDTTIAIKMPVCYYSDVHGPIKKIQVLVAEAGGRKKLLIFCIFLVSCMWPVPSLPLFDEEEGVDSVTPAISAHTCTSLCHHFVLQSWGIICLWWIFWTVPQDSTLFGQQIILVAEVTHILFLINFSRVQSSIFFHSFFFKNHNFLEKNATCCMCEMKIFGTSTGKFLLLLPLLLCIM